MVESSDTLFMLELILISEITISLGIYQSFTAVPFTLPFTQYRHCWFGIYF